MFSMFQKHVYQSLPHAEDPAVEGKKKHSISLRRWPLRWPSPVIFLAGTNLCTFVWLLYMHTQIRSIPTDHVGWRDVATRSPALDIIEFDPPRHYDAAFRQTNPYRNSPGQHSNEVDVAWHQIELGAGGIRLTEEEVQALNGTPTADAPLHRVPEEHGGGYLGMLEVFHLLHCLNSLRMYAYFNYDHYAGLDDGVPEENKITHLDHCIDMLRMSIMCTADVTPALFYDPLSKPLRRDPLPDWSSLHTCRNFDAILEWNKHGPRAVKWRDAGVNPAWDPDLPGSDPMYPKDDTDTGHHH